MHALCRDQCAAMRRSEGHRSFPLSVHGWIVRIGSDTDVGMQTMYQVLATVVLAAITFVTLSPARMRPRVARPSIERGVAFFVLGFSFGGGFPEWPWITLAGVVCAASVLELLQRFVPGRHGEIADAAQKAAGGVLGWGIAALISSPAF